MRCGRYAATWLGKYFMCNEYSLREAKLILEAHSTDLNQRMQLEQLNCMKPSTRIQTKRWWVNQTEPTCKELPWKEWSYWKVWYTLCKSEESAKILKRNTELISNYTRHRASSKHYKAAITIINTEKSQVI